MMQHPLCSYLAAVIGLASISIAAAPEAAAALTYYVAPDGNDTWPGTAAEPRADGSDGPFATIQRARDAIRAVPRTDQITVLIREGVYHVTEPIRFGPEDSGAKHAPVVYASYRGESPVIHGGREITGWTQEGALWVADVPDVREGGWDFGALWVNGERRQPARTPNATHVAGDYPAKEDFFYMDGPVMETDAATNKENSSAIRFRYRAGDVQDWPSLQDAVFVVFHSWATSLHRVKAHDLENRLLEFTGPARWHFAYWRPDQWYFIEHLFEALDQPGEWFLNRKEGKLYYIPMPGEDMAAAHVVAPVATQLIAFDGDPAAGRFVQRLYLRGLRFQYTDWPIGPQGHSDGQAESSVGGVIEATGARMCGIENCEIAHVGSYGVWFRRGSQHCWMRRCEVTDLGAGGVRIGETGDPATPDEAASHVTIDNCFLHDGGRIYRSAVGVWIGRSSYNEISHNDICDFRYSGVSVGWSWGYAPSSAHHNIIAHNRIHDVGKGQLSDMGGIYTLGDSPGTVLHDNYIHDVLSNGDISGGWGLYTDEGSTGIVMENNIVFHTRTGTFHQHYGRENILRNNILAFSEREQLIRSRQEDHISFFFEGNIVYFDNGRLLGSNWSNGNFRMNRNIYWDTSGQGFNFAGKTFDEWKAAGFDVDSQIADPLLVDIARRDFTLKQESPALAMGFKPINMKKIGLYGDPEWVNKPNAIPRGPVTRE